MEKLISELTDLRGISGFEYRIAEKVAEYLRPYSDEIKIDNLGNIIAVKRCGKKNAKSIMIEAHMDEIGLMINDIDKRGFLSFVAVGGVDGRILPSSEVTVHGKKNLSGVIGSKPPHLQKRDEKDKATKIEDMYIDLGMSYDEAIKYVSVGDSVTFQNGAGKLGDNQFSGKTLDDRAGVAALIKTMEKLSKVKTDVDVYAVVSVQEEVGLRGAKTAAYGVNPTLAIAVDVCHAITPDNSKNAFESGSGAIISIGPNIHPKVQKRLADTAEKYNIKVEFDVDGGDTGTDAWAIQTAKFGIPTGLLSIPLKYMHTSVETINISDAEAVSEILTFFIQNLDSDMEDWLCL